MIKKPYQAAFIIPAGARKFFGENGWEFRSSRRLPNDLADYLMSVFSLELVETYAGIKRCLGQQMDMQIVCDSNDEIENLYLRLNKICPAKLVEIFQAFDNFNEIEIFIPEIAKNNASTWE